MPPIRLGVIGAGLIWIRTHKPILETMTDAFMPVAFCDISEQRRAAVAQEFPGVPLLSDYRQLLELAEVDTVLVLTPIALNAPVAHAALQAHKHVIMEKPIARSVAEGRELIATARQAGRLLCVTEQMAYRPAGDVLADIACGGRDRRSGDVELRPASRSRYVHRPAALRLNRLAQAGRFSTWNHV